MGNPYRDGAGALEERLAALDQAIAEREAYFSEDFWELAAPSIDVAPPEGGAPRRRRWEAGEPDLAERVAGRQERLGRLEEAAARLDGIEASLREPPLTTPRCERRSFEVQGGTLLTPPEGRTARDGFERFAKQIAPEGHVAKVGEFSRALSIARGSVPIELMCDAGFVSAGQSNAFQVRLVAQTSVSLLTGPLDVRPQGIGDEVLGLFGLRKEHTLGHADFDGMFFIRGDEAATRDLLTDAVRDALLVMAREAVPSLVVGGGLARLEWEYEPRLPAMEAAFEILGALRLAKPNRSLRAATPA